MDSSASRERRAVSDLLACARPSGVVNIVDPESWVGAAIASAARRDEAPDVAGEVMVVPPLARAQDEAARVGEIAADRFAALESIVRENPPDRMVLLSGIEAVGPRALAEGRAFEGCEERPVDALGHALLDLERQVRLLCERADATLVVLRPGHLYGIDQFGCLAGLWQDLVAGDVEWVRRHWNSRPLLPAHVSDVATAAVMATAAGDWIYHVTLASVPTLGDVARQLMDVARWKGVEMPSVTEPHSPAPLADRVHYDYPDHRIERELGYRPRWSIAGGVGAVIDNQRMAARVRSRGGGDPALTFNAEAEGIATLESRFWDEHAAARDLLYYQPHDWAYDPGVGNVLQAPVYRFLHRMVRRERPRLILDLGCGNGVYSRHLARHGNVRAIGIDLSARQIEEARAAAAEAGVADRVEYRVADALEFEAGEKVDAICAFGALHHLPEIQEHLPRIISRNLRPGGFLLAVEPHCEEGFHPLLLRLARFFTSTRLRKYFDIERFEQVAAEARAGSSLRGESPAGLLVHDDEDIAIHPWLAARYQVLDSCFTHALAPFLANAFVVYQRAERVRRVARFLMPAAVRLDDTLCHFGRVRRWAALGMIAVRP